MLAVIWVLLAMLAGVALFSHWVHGSLQHAQQRQHSINAQIASYSAESTALFIRLTGMRSAYGVAVRQPSADAESDDYMSMFDMDDDGGWVLNHEKAAQAEIFPFDAKVWRYGGLNFVAQDTAGLLGMMEVNHGHVVRSLLAEQNIRVRPQQLIDSYLDYRDADSERRLHGAETFDYRQQQRAEPLNGVLRSPLQLRDVLHWDKALQHWSNGDLLYLLRVAGGDAVNVNSAPKEVLKMVLNNLTLAEALVERRSMQPIDSVFDVEAMVQDESVGVLIQPAGGLRFWWWEQNSPSAWVSEYHYETTVAGPEALQRDWKLRVDVPAPLASQVGREIKWTHLPPYPDYLGRRAAGVLK